MVGAGKGSGPWEIDRLREPPAYSWGRTEHLPEYDLKELYYEGESYRGRKTRVFAYYAAPREAERPLPSIVLVHGGAGKAFPEWAGQWAARGYAAIAMDLFGNGPDGARLEDGGPEQNDETLFWGLSEESVREMWSYHAVAGVVRAISLAASLPEVDASKIGVMGISWGGYVSGIVTGLDSRPAYAMLVYAAGYFREGSCWMDRLSRLGENERRLWDEAFDVGAYIGRSSTPTLWATGTNDECFHLSCWRKTVEAAQGDKTLRLIKDWEHNYAVPWETREFLAYADSRVRGGKPLPAILGIGEERDGTVRFEYATLTGVRKAELIYTADGKTSPSSRWERTPAEVWENGGNRVTCRLPAEAATYFFTLEDEEGNTVSTEVRDTAARTEQ